MIDRRTSHSYATPINDPVKAATPNLSAKSALAIGLRRSMRVVGTLHLPMLVRPPR
jgi:hypothetical protein